VTLVDKVFPSLSNSMEGKALFEFFSMAFLNNSSVAILFSLLFFSSSDSGNEAWYFTLEDLTGGFVLMIMSLGILMFTKEKK
jgi:hypothetical protein